MIVVGDVRLLMIDVAADRRSLAKVICKRALKGSVTFGVIVRSEEEEKKTDRREGTA